jgi:hypothetical protein
VKDIPDGFLFFVISLLKDLETITLYICGDDHVLGESWAPPIRKSLSHAKFDYLEIIVMTHHPKLRLVFENIFDQNWAQSCYTVYIHRSRFRASMVTAPVTVSGSPMQNLMSGSPIQNRWNLG